MKILLGSLVTQMAGSVAGQTVRRFRGGFVLQNKVQRKASFFYIKNQRLAQISATFSSWPLLTALVRDSWNLQATFYPFKDKFGNDKFLSGREFYTKLSTQAFWAGVAPPKVNALKSGLADWTLIFNSSSIGNEEVSFDIDTEVDGWRLVVCAIPMRSLARNTDPVRAPKIALFDAQNGTGLNIFNEIVAKYGVPVIGSVFRVVAYQVTESGFVSSPLWFDFAFDA